MALYWNDIRNFAGKLTLPRLWNAGKILSSYYLSRWTGKPVQWGLPFNISIEPTTTCNLGCPECPSGLRSFTRPTGNLEFELYKKVLDDCKDHLIYQYFYFQGEPYMHPQFLDLVKLANENKVYSVTSTNAHFLTDRKAKETVESGLDRIIISLDGTDQETYEQYRVNGKMDKVIEGTKRLVEWKTKLKSPTPHIILQFLVVKPNEHQIDEVKAMGVELGVDEVKLKTAQIYDYAKGSPLIPENEQYSRYAKQPDGTYQIKSAWHDHCWKLWHACVVTWDGRVVPCCFDKDASHQMGDLRKHRLSEIWWDRDYAAFRGQVLKGRSEVEMCRNCTEGLEVWG
jgi:radical SAM protein with 4Fe4S-binding SPASM domain